MSTEELLRAGITAAKASDISTASKLLMQVVKADPNSELGWFWLGLCRTDPKQRDYCFRRVLAINPQNSDAARQIEYLHQPIASSQGAPPSLHVDTSQQGTVLPFIETEPVRPEKNNSPAAKKTIPPGRRKKSDRLFLWGLLGLVIFACVAIAGIFALRQLINLTSAPGLGNQVATSVPTVGMATSIPNYEAAFEATSCEFRIPEGANVTCGFAIVPEDRSGDVADTIKIAIAVYHATGSAPKPDPIFIYRVVPEMKPSRGVSAFSNL